MGKNTFLTLIAIFIANMVFAEEIKISTIIPKETVTRVKKAAVGEAYRVNTSTPGNEDIYPNNLVVEGPVSIGAKTTDAMLNIEGDGTLLVPRSDNVPVDAVNGMIYYNNTRNAFIFRQNGRWENVLCPRIIRGVIGADGSIISGTGFSVVHSNPGAYQILVTPTPTYLYILPTVTQLSSAGVNDDLIFTVSVPFIINRVFVTVKHGPDPQDSGFSFVIMEI